MDPEDASKRLNDLLALDGDIAAMRSVIGELGEGAGDLLLAAVLRLSSLAAAAALGADTTAADPEQSPGADEEELPVADPWVDHERPYSASLDVARQLRMALLDQPDLPGVLNAVGALSSDELALIVLEMAVDAWWTRTLEGGAD